MLCPRAAVAALALLALAPAAALAQEPGPGRTLGFLHVGPVGGPGGLPQITDGQDRQILLRGVNVNGLGDYYRPSLKAFYSNDPAAFAHGACPDNDVNVRAVMVCQLDFAQMRPLGFNSIRLAISWSLLEPNPGAVDPVYVDRIAQVVDWARAQGIYVIIDLHQDAWSKYIYSPPGQTCPPGMSTMPGFDGAPRWASEHVSPVCAAGGVRDLDNAVQEDFQKLYANAPGPDGVGLQDHYAHLFSVLAQRFGQDPTVAGYEIINEPEPGFNPTPSMDASELFPFYAKVVNTVVHDVPSFHQLFFVEPNTTRDVTDQSAIVAPWSAYSPYPNVVYAPHIYTGVFTADASLAGQRFFPDDGGYKSAISDAQHLGLPVWVGEFGNSPSDDNTILRRSYALQDQYGVSSELWLWKEDFWGVFGKPFGPGTPQPGRLKYVDRAYPLAIAGDLRSLYYDPDRRMLDLTATSPAVTPGERSRATVVFVPEGSPGDILAQGARVEVRDRGAAREAFVYPTGGDYRVYQGPAAPRTPLTSTGSSAPGGGQRRPGFAPGGPVLAFISGPSTQACLSRRRLTLTVGHRRGVRVTRVRLTVNGRRRRLGRAAPRRLTIDLRGQPRGVYRIAITVRVRVRGRTRVLSAVRVYHTCVPGRRA
ncbi:MAG TPA: cellulase family glycosylhydrolase [Solirubrobacteraceae bacterium]|nr:cellulase family glycosylhydrolase [Solirubrobacteraceae bacterium]